MLVHVTMLFPGRVEEYNSGFYNNKKSQFEHSNRTLKSVRSANEVMLQQAIALMTSNGESLNSGRRSAQESITSSYLGSFISAYTIVDISYKDLGTVVRSLEHFILHLQSIRYFVLAISPNN